MDPVNVVNVALGQLGEKRLTKLNELVPESRVEELAAVNFIPTVRLALEAREWTFATGWLKLAASTEAPVHPLQTKRFLLPSTVVRVVGVDDGGGTCTLPYRKEGPFIIADVNTLYVRAVQVVDDPNRWSPTFAFAVAFKLAALLAVPVAENLGLEERMELRYQRYLREAAALDGMQGTAEQKSNVGPRPSDMRR